uniref:Nucleotidyl transferase AbiEii/AbiGii toxin family protein n=1 Tax=Trichobilharzia regenti TaxID=157069 RepID=A0AA85IRY9_TRIRE|nr:unnamed protein product [Trichobilharzia regenti]
MQVTGCANVMDHPNSSNDIDLSEFPFFHMSDDEIPITDEGRDAAKCGSLLSFNMFGTCSLKNVKHIIRQNRCLKPLRLHLLKHVLNLCRNAGLEPFVYGGTALSVFRENGKFIPHDTDIDLGILEFDSNGFGIYTILMHYCLKNRISIYGIGNVDDSILLNPDSDVYIDFSASISKRVWLKAKEYNVVESIEEFPYDGVDCKRIKFFFTSNGLLKACELLKMNLRTARHVLSDPCLAHVDLFTLSHVDSSEEEKGLEVLRVNWNLPGIYDCKRKLFPYNSFFPLKQCKFEDVDLLAPYDLKTYLSIEYGYLGRDAVYSPREQLYVKIPANYSTRLPSHMV